jgi:hypothetical protein
MAEFLALSAKVSDKTATDAEKARWRELRTALQPPKPKPPLPGQKPREHPRASHKLKLHYALVPEMTVAFSDELGGGGLRLRAQKHLDPGTPMVLRIDLENGHALTVEANVVWCKREGGHFAVGVEFRDLPSAEAERLEALLHRKP